MSRKKISTTIYVTPEQNEQLKVLHARTKVPVAVFIREGIDLVLARHAHLLPGQLQLTPAASPDSGPPPSGLPLPERVRGALEPLQAVAAERKK